MTHVAIISSGRSANVGPMEAHCRGLDPTWYVADGDAPDYRVAGAANVIEAGSLCVARNLALDNADGAPCLQLSDDLRGIGHALGRTSAEVMPLSLGTVVDMLAQAMDETGAHLAGCAPTSNPFYSRDRVHRTGFVVGDLVLVDSTCELRFDEALRLKEDYDYTLQHLAAHGVVARCDWLLADFLHRRNRGGAVAYRTPTLEQATIAYLMGKWPGQLRLNPRRTNEVLLRWRPPAA